MPAARRLLSWYRRDGEIVIETVLVGVDGSRAAGRAAELGVTFASKLGVELHALHVIDPAALFFPTVEAISGSLGAVPQDAGSSAVRPNLKVLGRALLEQVRSSCEQRGVLFRASLLEGRPAHALLDCMNVDTLAVVGRTGREQEVLRERTGSVARHLLRHATTPRLLVDESAPLPRRIVAGFDDSPAARGMLHVAAHLAWRCGYPLHVVHAARHAGDDAVLLAAQRQLTLYEELTPTFEQLVGAPSGMLLERYGEETETILALGARGRPRLADLLLGATTSLVHQHARITLLVDG
jgi:nucleotide-binding universal stress UspA family protein